MLKFTLIYFSSIVKQAIFAYVNHAQMGSWNQLVLGNEGKVSCSRKQQQLLMGLEHMTVRHSPMTSQTPYPVRHAAPHLLFISSQPTGFFFNSSLARLESMGP